MPAISRRPSDYSELSDDRLVDLAREGDAAAYGELWRRHSGIGASIARRYYEIADPDDLVSESFARILSTLQRGGGPHSGFRPYLITTIGNVARRWATQSREGASDQLDYLEDPKTVDDPIVAASDRGLALEAFRSLPDRWQAVLWYSAVEGMGPTEIGRNLGMSPNATAVLAHRARAGLRSAWIQAHLNDETLSDQCRWTSGRLGRRATGSLSPREQVRVKDHLSTCIGCRRRARELDQLSSKLAVLLVPALLGLGAALHDDGASAVAATAEAPLSALPALAPAHIWLTGVAVAVVTAAALVTSSTPTDWAAGENAATPTVSRSESSTDNGPVTPVESLTTLADPTTAVDQPSSDESGETRSNPLSGTSDGTPTPPTTAPPAAPAVTSAIDPDSLVPPTLVGTASPGAQIIVTDELGQQLAAVVADASGAWSTPALASVSPAAAALVIRQVDILGQQSPPTVVDLAARPFYLSPLPGDATDASSAFELIVVGLPGSTVHVTFSPSPWPGYPDYPPVESSYPESTIVLDWEGLGTVPIDSSIWGSHRADLRYVEGARSSAGVRSFNFVVWLPD